MRNLALANSVACLATALFAGGAALAMSPAASAAPAGGVATRGAAPNAAPGVELVQDRSAACAELRRACLYKKELGERGQGNCSKYRSECTGSSTSREDTSYSRYRTYRAYRPWRYDD